jgi:hypothetical protein
MRAVYKYESTWLAGLLFPFKLYVVLAVIGVLSWRAMLPEEYSDAREFAIGAFNAVKDFLTLGYFLSTVLLVGGGLIQVLRNSRRAAAWSFGFALAALIIGVWLSDCGPSSDDITILKEAAR